MGVNTSNATRLADQAADFLTVTTHCVSTVELLMSFQGWRMWVPGPYQSQALKLGEQLRKESADVGRTAIILRTNGPSRVVAEVNRVMSALNAVAALVEQRERNADKWRETTQAFVATRNDAETVVRAELAQLREVDRLMDVEDPTAADLLTRARAMEQVASEMQGTEPLGEHITSRLVDDYLTWLADALAWLPDDLKDRFRGEYEGSTLSPKIKQFLNEPRKPSLLASSDRVLTPVPLYPFDQCFRASLTSQRQIIIEASRRPRRTSTDGPSRSSSDLDPILRDLQVAAQAAEDELLSLAKDLDDDTGRYNDAIEPFDRAWSRSNIGPHALMYYEGLQEPPPGRQWDRDWGFLNSQPGWSAANHNEVISLIEQEAGLTLTELDQRVRYLRDRIRYHHDRLVRTAARVPHELAQRVRFDERRSRLEELDENTISLRKLTEGALSGKYSSRDIHSLQAGVRLAPHQNVEMAAIAAFAVAERARDLVKAASLAVATAEGLRHLPQTPRNDIATIDDHEPQTDQLTALVSGVALVIVMIGLAIGCALLIVEADSNIDPTDGRFALWPLIRALAGGVGVLAVVLAGSTIWYGLIQRRLDHVPRTFRSPLRWGAATAAAAVLVFIFGIA